MPVHYILLSGFARVESAPTSSTHLSPGHRGRALGRRARGGQSAEGYGPGRDQDGNHSGSWTAYLVTIRCAARSGDFWTAPKVRRKNWNQAEGTVQCGRGAEALYNVLEDKSTGLVRTVRVSPSAEAGALQSAGKDERLRVEQIAQALLARAHKTNRTGTPK